MPLFVLTLARSTAFFLIKYFGAWDIDYGSITGTIHLDEETNQLELIEYVNGYPKEYEYPFEDLRVDVLEEVLGEYLM